jgi:hypothetical protein
MLDLLTVFAAMGVQSDLDEIRKQRGEDIVEAEQDNTAASPATHEVVQTIESGINAVENCISSAVNAVCNIELSTPVIDLTLPTTAVAAK